MVDEQKPNNAQPETSSPGDAQDNAPDDAPNATANDSHDEENDKASPADDADNKEQKFTERLPQTGMLEISDEPKPMPKRQPTGTTAMLTNDWMITFEVEDEQTTLPIDREIVVGRRSENSNMRIDFDLTPFGAYHYGVSRKHAIISLDAGNLYIEDLGSTNGTRINGFQLTAHQKYRLRDNDELEFARLRTVIHFQEPDKSR